MRTSARGSPDDHRAAVRFILCFGLVSLFADMTYEGAHSIVGPLLKGLGASAAAVGIIAGFGEMVAASLRYFSGRFADQTRAYWKIAIAGYAINLVAVPALALVGTWQAAAALIIVERAGKAMRGPSRDVLISEANDVVGHGFGWGVHAAMDQIGAIAGPLMVAAIVAYTHDFGPAFLTLGIPATLALAAVFLARRARPQFAIPKGPPPAADLPRAFWPYVAASGMLAAGFLDFPLMAYHFEAQKLFATEVIPLLYAGAMATEGVAAMAFGRLYDRFGISVLVLGIALSLAALPLAFLGGAAGAIASVVCWGIGMGAQDATLRSGIARVVSMNKRGTAFGTFNAVFGVMWFLGSAAMGLLYDQSLVLLVAFGVAAQIIAATLFLSVRGRLEPPASHFPPVAR
jgi:MFS family permease